MPPLAWHMYLQELFVSLCYCAIRENISERIHRIHLKTDNSSWMQVHSHVQIKKITKTLACL